MKRILLVCICLMTLGSASAHAATTNLIIELVPFAVADGARESLNIYGQVSEGTTSYCQLSGGGYGVQITRVDGLGGPLVETQLVAPSNWLAVSGKTFLTGYYGFDVWGDYLQFCGATLRQIWRVNKHTGAIAVHISQEAITNALGSTDVQMSSPYMTDHRDGAVLFRDSKTQSIIRALDSSNIAFYVTASQLSNTFGNTAVTGGMTMDGDGNLYFCGGTLGTNRAVIVYTTNNTLSVAVPTAAITNLLNIGGINPQEIFCAPDGWIYLAVGLGGNINNIVRFAPTNPIDSLQMVLTLTQLYASVSGPQVASLDWHQGLTWHTHEARPKGVYSYLTDLAALLAITGAAEIVEYTTNAPYTCAVRLTNAWGAALAYDRTSTATWSMVGAAPEGVVLEGNLLTVGALISNTVVTLQAASEFGDLAATGTYAVVLTPEPTGMTLLALVCWRARKRL
ncbi:MAG: hypothetical protein NTV22_00055 [bacterium]|nr:hypothetical protein [bacterium]